MGRAPILKLWIEVALLALVTFTLYDPLKIFCQLSPPFLIIFKGPTTVYKILSGLRE